MKRRLHLPTTLIIVALVAIVIAILHDKTVQAGSATLTVNASTSNAQVGDIFTVNIDLSATTNPVTGAEFTIEFNDNIVQFRHLGAGDLLRSTGRQAICPPPARLQADQVKLICATSGIAAGPTADGTLFFLTFEAVGIGFSQLDLSTAQGADNTRPPTLITINTVNGGVSLEGKRQQEQLRERMKARQRQIEENNAQNAEENRLDEAVERDFNRMLRLDNNNRGVFDLRAGGRASTSTEQFAIALRQALRGSGPEGKPQVTPGIGPDAGVPDAAAAAGLATAASAAKKGTDCVPPRKK